jgi:hypothetical protein
VLGTDPAAKLTLAGARPTADIIALGGRGGIRVAGEVPDLAPLYRSHAVFAAPIRFGSGTRLKILEAMASGIPVVSTTVGAEGLGMIPGTHLLVADDAEAFAESLARLLHDDELRHRLAEAARAEVVARFGWDAIAHRALAVVDATSPPRRSRMAMMPVRDVTVIVHALDGPGGWPEGLDQQTMAGSWNAVWAGPSPCPVASVASLTAPTDDHGMGTRLNALMEAVQARVVVFLAAGSRIPDAEWLSRITAPLQTERPPAAVQGGVTFVGASGGVSDPHHGPIGPICAAVDGAPVPDLACLAIDRDVWREFPFAPADEPAEYLWLQDLRSGGTVRAADPRCPGPPSRHTGSAALVRRRPGPGAAMGQHRCGLRLRTDPDGHPGDPHRFPKNQPQTSRLSGHCGRRTAGRLDRTPPWHRARRTLTSCPTIPGTVCVAWRTP